MVSQGFKNYLKSISLGNLSTIDDNSNDVDESPLSAQSHYRTDKQNLSSINEQKRELHQKLKEFSDLTYRSFENGYDIDFPQFLPENNLDKRQGSISKETYQQQSAMWELIVTEQNFLKQIQFIVEVYISVFEKLTKDFFPKINISDIFSNLKEVYKVSLEFWKECMYPLVKELIESQNSLQSHLLKNGFIKIGEILEPYILYCTEISACRSYILALEKGNELFSEYTKWAIEFEESNREMLCDHLAKPFQRLTKYKILLQAIQKYSSIDEKSDIQEMIEAVDQFVTRVNEKVEEKTLSRKLLYLHNQIDSYDVIDHVADDLLQIVNQFNKFDLTAPIYIGGRKVIRQLCHQGEVKLREGPSKNIDVKLYLFTDILLITKPKKKTFGKMKIIKSPVILENARFQRITNNAFVCICLNEFNCISSLYHLSYSDSKKVDEWMQKLEEAVKHHSNLKVSLCENTLPREFQNSIPKVKVVQSSPKRNLLQSQSSIDNMDNLDNANEWNFKRKSPVARKYKNKKDITVYSSDLPLELTPLQRKNSQPTLNTLEIDEIQKLSKSNSCHERNKKTIVKQISHNSDIDDSTPVTDILSSNHDLDKLCQCCDTGFNDYYDIIDNTNVFIIDYHRGPVIKIREMLNKNISKSLNKLND